MTRISTTTILFFLLKYFCLDYMTFTTGNYKYFCLASLSDGWSYLGEGQSLSNCFVLITSYSAQQKKVSRNLFKLSDYFQYLGKYHNCVNRDQHSWVDTLIRSNKIILSHCLSVNYYCNETPQAKAMREESGFSFLSQFNITAYHQK